MIPSSKTLRSPEGDNGINCIDNYVQHSPTESDAPSIDLIPVIRTGPAFGPFASTLKKEHDDLSEQVLRDLSRHKVSRELSETIFTRLKTEAPTTANFNLDNIPTHPDLVGSVSTCSETSMFGLHSRQNSDGFAAGDVEGYEQGTPSESSSPVGLGLDYYETHSIQQPAPFYGQVKEAIPDKLTEDSPQEIESLLDCLVSNHQVEYLHHIEKQEKLSRNPSSSSTSSRPKLQTVDSSPITEEITRTDLFDNDRYGNYHSQQRFANYRTRSYGNTPGNIQTSFSNTPTHINERSNDDCLIPFHLGNSDQEQIIKGITDRLLEVGFHRRNRSNSGPPAMERAGVLDRNSTFQTEPSGTSFACIFTVQIPQSGHISAPLSRLGRPLIPDGIATDKFTVVATYHPSYRHLVVDILEYCHCPAGFESSQIVDLMYLQNSAYLPPYCIWPIQSYSSQRYQVTSQWSLCTTNANGHDILYVSDLDVLVQRIASCMYRANEGRNMSKSAHRRYIESISEGCVDVCQVELYSKAARLSRRPMFTTASIDYRRSAVLDWRPLIARPGSQLPHSRCIMPIRQF
ncbi:hypothetical protein BDD12DRAFT_913434 [Trichophaea hybrida]|nr:hypothetical protein BDD12DRAFT_913434 [Trichophaea hybrida]